MQKVRPLGSGELRIGKQGRAVLPAPIRRAAHLKEGDRMVVHVEAPGVIRLETPEAIQSRVWAASSNADSIDAVVDVRAMRDEDNGIADANFAHRSIVSDPATAESVGARLLRELDL